MFLRVVTTPFITAYADRAKDRANVLLVLVGRVAGRVAAAISCRRPTASCWLSRWRCPSSGRRIRRWPIRWRCRACGASARTIPACASGARSPSSRPISSAASSCRWTSAEAVPVIMIASACASALAGGAVRAAARAAAPRLAAVGGRPAGRRRSCSTAISCCSSPAPASSTASHGFLYGFVSIYWKSIGLGDTLIGLLWAWAVVAEVVHVHGLHAGVRPRFGDDAACALRASAAIVRWIAFPLIWPLGLGVPGFFAVQALHALSTGADADRPAEADRRNGAGGADRRGARRRLLRQRLFAWPP